MTENPVYGPLSPDDDDEYYEYAIRHIEVRDETDDEISADGQEAATAPGPSQDGSGAPVHDIRPCAGVLAGALHRSGVRPRIGPPVIFREYLD